MSWRKIYICKFTPRSPTPYYSTHFVHYSPMCYFFDKIKSFFFSTFYLFFCYSLVFQFVVWVFLAFSLFFMPFTNPRPIYRLYRISIFMSDNNEKGAGIRFFPVLDICHFLLSFQRYLYVSNSSVFLSLLSLRQSRQFPPKKQHFFRTIFPFCTSSPSSPLLITSLLFFISFCALFPF